MTTANRPAHVIAAHTVLLSILRCKNGMQRGAYCFGTLRRPDAAPLLVGLDWALSQGLIQYGTTNASAKVWSSRANGGFADTDQTLYLTKAGKQWLRDSSPNHDFGSGLLFAEKLAAAKTLTGQVGALASP